MVCKFVRDGGARSVAFENGSADIGYRTPVALADLERLKKLPHLVFSTDGTSYSYNVQTIQFNLDSQYFKHLKVRQAVVHAIDRAAMLKAVAYGYGTVCHVPISPKSEYHDPTPSPYKLDLKKAEELLDEAGFKRGPDKIRFKVPMDFNPIGDESRKVCEFTRAALGRIGITVEIRAQDLSAFSKRIYTDREFDFTYNGHSNLFDPTVGVQRIYWSKNFKKGVPFSNASNYNNPKVRRAARSRRSRERSGQAQGDVHGVPEDLRRGSAGHQPVHAALSHDQEQARARGLADRRRRRVEHVARLDRCIARTTSP
jgi:peptide/nickel transport system substrate-binding protein